MRTVSTRILILGSVLLLAAALSGPAAAGDARAAAARGGGGSPPATASGHATYGYGSHGGYGHGGYPYHHHGGYVGVGFYGGWGWPYYGYGYGYYGWPYYGWPYYGYYGSPYYWGAYASRTVYMYGGDREQAPAAVETNVRPPKAKVSVDGQPMGKAKDYNSGSWGPLPLPPGQHVLEFSLPGYQTLRTVLDARTGAHYTIEDQLVKGEGLDPRSVEPPPPQAEPAPAVPEAVQTEVAPAPAPSSALRTGLLRVRVSPDDAAVYLDGEFLGRAGELNRLHGAIPVVRGEHRVEVVMPGRAPQSQAVEVGEGAPAEVRIDLGS